MFIFPDEMGDFCAGKESEDARGESFKICNEFQNMQNLQGWEGVGANFPRILARLSRRFCNFAIKIAKILRLGIKINEFICSALDYSYLCCKLLVASERITNNVREDGMTRTETRDKQHISPN
jgi:hypothetical protein